MEFYSTETKILSSQLQHKVSKLPVTQQQQVLKITPGSYYNEKQ